jgi:hypothetical protein
MFLGLGYVQEAAPSAVVSVKKYSVGLFILNTFFMFIYGCEDEVYINLSIFTIGK